MNPAIVYRDVLGEVKQYLESVATLRRLSRPEALNGFFGPEDLVLQRGTVYRNGGHYGTPIPKACFHRSYLAATRKGSKWIYVEGWASSGRDLSIAVWHAWLTKADNPGVAYDAAWSEAENAVYLGVPFTAEYLKTSRRRSGTCGGVLYDMLNYGDDLTSAIWTR